MGFSARLTKNGFVRCDKGASDPIRTDDVFSLLRIWHWTLEGIDEDVTLGDLFALLDPVEGIENLSPMLSTDVRALLDEAKKPSTRDPEDRIEYVEVCNRTELSTYVPDPERPDEEPFQWLDEEEEEDLDQVEEAIADLTGEPKPFRIYDATGDDPITGEPESKRLKLGEMYGTWGGPYTLWRDFHGWGRWEEPYEGYFEKHPEIDPKNYYGGYGLSLSPVQDLMHYPLRYNAEFELRDDLYGGNVLVKDTLVITVGEFIHAIFWDLGFYGTPEDREQVAEELDQRIGQLRAQEEREG